MAKWDMRVFGPKSGEFDEPLIQSPSNHQRQLPWESSEDIIALDDRPDAAWRSVFLVSDPFLQGRA
jgi:hypothetical protein